MSSVWNCAGAPDTTGPYFAPCSPKQLLGDVIAPLGGAQLDQGLQAIPNNTPVNSLSLKHNKFGYGLLAIDLTEKFGRIIYKGQ